MSKLKDLTKSILLVSLSEFESDSVLNKKNFLKNELTHLIQNEEDIDVIDKDNDVLVENIPQQWFDNMLAEVEDQLSVEKTNSNENFHYLPEIVPNLKKIFRTIPLWSAIGP